jgi:hypothetical protein
MSHFKNALFFVGTLMWMAFGAGATAELNLSAPLVLADFDGKYGEALHQTTLSAVKNLAQNKSATSSTWAAYWYAYLDGIKLISGLSTKDEIGITSGDMEKINDGGIGHFSFEVDASSSTEYPGGEVSCNFYTDKDSVDLSKMTAITFKAKGTGTVRIGIMSRNIKNANDWGYCSDTIKLPSAWTVMSIPIAKLKPAPYSATAKAGKVTWADCKTSAYGFQIKTEAQKGAEVNIDSIAFAGMTYGDIMQKVSVKPFSASIAKTGAAISVKNSIVTYTVNATQNVSVSLLNADGKEISNLFTGNASLGTHSMALPKSVIPGTYVIRMNSAQGTVSHKFTLVK